MIIIFVQLVAQRGAIAQRLLSVVIESTHCPLPLVPGWVFTRVHRCKNLATYTRVANLPFSYEKPTRNNHPMAYVAVS